MRNPKDKRQAKGQTKANTRNLIAQVVPLVDFFLDIASKGFSEGLVVSVLLNMPEIKRNSNKEVKITKEEIKSKTRKKKEEGKKS